MSERIFNTSDGTIAWVAPSVGEAEHQAARLRAAGLSDVRLSERSGTTEEAHVSVEEGLTASDFAARLESAGFDRDDARSLTDAVARGGTLLTLAAGVHFETALAVLRGEDFRPRTVGPVDPASPLPTAVFPAGRRQDDVAEPGLEGAVATEPEPSENALFEVEPRAGHAAGAAPAGPAGASGVEIAGVVPLREERLDLTREREYGEARVRKEVVTEQRTITVPVQHEELVIEREGQPDVRISLSEEAAP